MELLYHLSYFGKNSPENYLALHTQSNSRRVSYFRPIFNLGALGQEIYEDFIRQAVR